MLTVLCTDGFVLLVLEQLFQSVDQYTMNKEIEIESFRVSSGRLDKLKSRNVHLF